MAKRRSASSAPAKRPRASAASTRRKIDVSDIPEVTPAQFRVMRRGRPLDGEYAKQMIAIRLDPGLLCTLRAEAKRRAMGYQTFIHELLDEATDRLIDYSDSPESTPAQLRAMRRVRPDQVVPAPGRAKNKRKLQ